MAEDERKCKMSELDAFMRDFVGESSGPFSKQANPTLSLKDVARIVEGGKECSVCFQEFQTSERLTDHLFTNHLQTDSHPSARARCPFPGCVQYFSVPSKVMSHFNRDHKPQKLVSATRCKVQDCGFENRVLGLFCPKDHLCGKKTKK